MSDQKQSQISSPTKEDVSKKVLGAMGRSFNSDSTINWLRNMSEDVSPAESLLQGDEPPFMTMLSCVDTLFDHFQRYASTYEYDLRNDTSNDDLKFECNRPDFTKPSEGGKFQGTLATSRWALLIEAEPERIYAFIVPTENIHEFSTRREHYSPFFELHATESVRGHIWAAGPDVISFEHLSFIAKKLFARLVRISNRQASELEPFSVDIPKQAPGGSILGQTLHRIRYAATTDNARQVLQDSGKRTDEAFTELLCMLEQDHQELTKAGIAALRSGNDELKSGLSSRTVLLTETMKSLRPIAETWHKVSKE